MHIIVRKNVYNCQENVYNCEEKCIYSYIYACLWDRFNTYHILKCIFFLI